MHDRRAFWNHGSRIEIAQINENEGLLHTLFTMQQYRRQGWARKIMHEVIEYADERNITLYITAQEFGDGPGMDNARLVDFYSEFGFERCKDGPMWPARMVRHPSREIQAPL